MFPEQRSPLVLTAMTLRGIGSYLRGARLELRPLTVLCGRNGSGKSTWMKALNLLRDSLEKDALPFDFSETDYLVNDIRVLNACYHLTNPDGHEGLSDSESTNRFGPPGTIGLEFVATRALLLDVELQHGEEFAFRGLPQELLWLGRCPEGTRFRLRLAHPGYNDDDEATPELKHFVELQINDHYVIQMIGERRTTRYELRCSVAFRPDSDPGEPEVSSVASIDLAGRSCKLIADDISERLTLAIVDHFRNVLRLLLKTVLDGCFCIAAVRQPGEVLSQIGGDFPSQTLIAKTRYVGRNGEHSWQLERRFADELMSDSSGSE